MRYKAFIDGIKIDGISALNTEKDNGNINACVDVVDDDEKKVSASARASDRWCSVAMQCALCVFHRQSICIFSLFFQSNAVDWRDFWLLLKSINSSYLIIVHNFIIKTTKEDVYLLTNNIANSFLSFFFFFVFIFLPSYSCSLLRANERSHLFLVICVDILVGEQFLYVYSFRIATQSEFYMASYFDLLILIIYLL